jgi:alpha-1,6-mannosyltransferase
VVPGATTGLEAPGVVTVAAARLPFGDGYRMPASTTKWETVLRMLEPDVIEAGDIFVPGHAALEAGASLGVPVVGFCHTDAAALAALHFGEWAEAPAMKHWAGTFRRFDRVVAPSRHMANRLAEAGVDKVTVQMLGVDVERFHPSRADPARLKRRLGVPADARLLVFAGRPAREKNIDSLVCAVERLGEPYWLLLVGAGKDAHYSPRVIPMAYERDPIKLAELMASCDALVHANENEPFGLIVLESLASGVPVVGPCRGGVAELIDETVGQPVRPRPGADQDRRPPPRRTAPHLGHHLRRPVPPLWRTGGGPAGLGTAAGLGSRYRPVGTSLNGTSLSTRMSPGRPSTRSAMMLRRISSVPPAMRKPGANMSEEWKPPRIRASSGSSMIPY